MKNLITSIKIVTAIGLLWFLVHTAKLDFGLLPEIIHSPGWLFLTLSLYFVIVGISSWRWHKLNQVQGIQLSYVNTLLPTYLGIAFNNLLPGGVGGDFFRFYFLNKKVPARKSAVMLSIFCDRISGLTGIFIIVCLLSLFHFNLLSSQTYILYFLLACLLLCVTLIGLYFASALLPHSIGLSTWLTQRFQGKKWLNPLLSVLEAIRIYRNAKVVILECLGMSVVVQILIAVTCMLIAKLMHFPSISFTDYIVAIGLTQIVNLIPIAPGGFGVGEMAFANILTLLNPGISAMYATIFLAYRILGLFTYLPGIFVLIFDKQLLKKQTVFQNESIDIA